MLPCSAGMSEAVIAWRPRTLPEAVADFARAAVGAAAPASAVRARSLLWAAARLGTWGQGVGLECRPEVLLHPSVIERFVVVGMAGAPETRRRTVRTNLRSLARGEVLAVPQGAGAGPET